uniref:Integrase catalytic domain-containing protein n=1 Tax=Dicentrarchus labrax TaxID=13489 RepID=A0A8P4K6X5_DICLA
MQRYALNCSPVIHEKRCSRRSTQDILALKNVCRLHTMTAEAVITSMKAIFSRYGVPSEAFTDNGPQFSNTKFRQFADEWDFVHTTSSPHYPQSNGLVEKSVQTVKRLMCKAKDSGTDFSQSLLVYRTTPLECGMSLAQLLMGRRLRSNLPIQENLLKTEEGNRVKVFKEQQKAKQKFYYDKGTQNLPELHAGDQVRFKDKTNTWAQKATVLSEIQPRSYTIQTEDGAVLRQNRRHLLKGPATAAQQRTDAEEQPQHPIEDQSSRTLAQCQEQPHRKSLRNVKPPERLIEQI